MRQRAIEIFAQEDSWGFQWERSRENESNRLDCPHTVRTGSIGHPSVRQTEPQRYFDERHTGFRVDRGGKDCLNSWVSGD